MKGKGLNGSSFFISNPYIFYFKPFQTVLTLAEEGEFKL